ncbi:MAG TPA: hypothetical protein DDZ34_03300 [Syntrophaceae bacterium]|nr:hypothetical protein [Syntrophaceae bacterium]
MELFLCLCFIILNILDVTTTNRILSMGGYEANPIVWLLMKFHLFIPCKIAAVIFFVLLVLFSQPPTGLIMAACGCLLYLLIVGNNLYQIHQESMGE